MRQMPNLLLTWTDTMVDFGPDNFANLQRLLKDEIPIPRYAML